MRSRTSQWKLVARAARVGDGGSPAAAPPAAAGDWSARRTMLLNSVKSIWPSPSVSMFRISMSILPIGTGLPPLRRVIIAWISSRSTRPSWLVSMIMKMRSSSACCCALRVAIAARVSELQPVWLSVRKSAVHAGRKQEAGSRNRMMAEGERERESERVCVSNNEGRALC